MNGWPEPRGLQALPPDLTQAEQVVFGTLDLSLVKDQAQLMSALSTALKLGEPFGRNWDALYDVLTDEQRTPPRLALVLEGLPRFLETELSWAQELLPLLFEAQQERQERGLALWLLVPATG